MYIRRRQTVCTNELIVTVQLQRSRSFVLKVLPESYLRSEQDRAQTVVPIWFCFIAWMPTKTHCLSTRSSDGSFSYAPPGHTPPPPLCAPPTPRRAVTISVHLVHYSCFEYLFLLLFLLFLLRISSSSRLTSSSSCSCRPLPPPHSRPPPWASSPSSPCR